MRKGIFPKPLGGFPYNEEKTLSHSHVFCVFIVNFAVRMKILRIINVLSFVACVLTANAQSKSSLVDGLEYRLSAQMSLADGENTPLWLNANKYGLSSLDTENGYLRASIQRPLSVDDNRKWGIGYGLDVVGAYNHTSNIIVQQAFAELRWQKGVLTVGAKEQPMELKNQQLSSGSQTLGINARPIPQVRLALPDYWALPFTNGWVGIKGHVAYGKTTDDNWQADFTRRSSKYTEGTLFHSKAGFLKIGNEYRFLPVSLELGVEMACQFGGTSYNLTDVEGGSRDVMENKGGLSGMWDAFIPGGSESSEVTYQNASGNHLGTWMFRLNLDYDSWYFGLYGEHFFEDHSSMFQLDYDGYGNGSEWDVKKDKRYLLYDLKDMMLGAELKLKNCLYVNNIVFEYLYSKYQSGPIYHDHSMNVSDHIGGNDDYYNNYIYTGWQHWGQVMGNPLYLSPIYNTDGNITVKNNRLYAFHLGVSGDPLQNLHYRLLVTYQKGFGTYKKPYSNPRENLSVMAEATYSFPEESLLGGWAVCGAFGMDRGKLLGDNLGGQITITKHGILDFKKKKN